MRFHGQYDFREQAVFARCIGVTAEIREYLQ